MFNDRYNTPTYTWDCMSIAADGPALRNSLSSVVTVHVMCLQEHKTLKE